MIDKKGEKDGKLAKLKVMAFSKPERTEKLPDGEFEAMFNPEKYTKSYNIVYTAPNDVGKKLKLAYQRTEAGNYSFDFVIDGTGAAAKKVEVSNEVRKFLLVAYSSAEKVKRPNFLKLHWGGEIANCLLTKVDVNYTMFRPNGTPLRAVIKATFKEDLNVNLSMRSKKQPPPQKVEERTAKNSDRLAALCQDIYGSTDQMADVARANELDNIRSVEEGKQVKFSSANKTKK